MWEPNERDGKQSRVTDLSHRLATLVPFCAALGIVFGVYRLLYPARVPAVVTHEVDLLVLLGGGVVALVVDFYRIRHEGADPEALLADAVGD